MMSFEVNIVKNAVKTQIEKNILYCESLDFAKTILAIFEKNPISSKNMEIIVIEINNISIFKGLMLESEIKEEPNSSQLTAFESNKTRAPNKAIIQYKLTFNPKILIDGLIIDVAINATVTNKAITRQKISTNAYHTTLIF